MTSLKHYGPIVRRYLPNESKRAIATRCEMRDIADGCGVLLDRAGPDSAPVLSILVALVGRWWCEPMSEARLKMIWGEVQRLHRCSTALIIAETME